jgi:DNA-binding GntR family transcriptional regulator
MAKTGTGQYAPAADALRRDITSGALAPGAWLPSEAQVMQIYQVSRYGAREAIKRLAGEGLVVVVDGKGSYVRARRDRAAHADTRGLRREIDAHGRVRYGMPNWPTGTPPKNPAATAPPPPPTSPSP